MERKRRLVTRIVAVLALATPTAAQDVEGVARVDRSLVHLATEDITGSGFLFGDARTIVTNRHVVESAGIGGHVEVRTIVVAADGAIDLSAPEQGTVVALHPRLDLAVVERAADAAEAAKAIGGEPLAPLPDTRLLPRGTAVLVHGFPGTMDPIVSRGILSGHHREITDDARYYLLDAASGSGSSGGPVTDLEGRLVGVVTAIYLPEDWEESGFNWCFAIPAPRVAELFDAEGRVLRSPLPVPIAELVEEVQRAAAGARMERIESGMQAILDTRVSARALAEDLVQFLEQTLTVLHVENAVEARRFLTTMLRLREATTRIATGFGLRGDATLEDDEAWEALATREEELTRRLGQTLVSAVGPAAAPAVEITGAFLEVFLEEIERRLPEVDGAERVLLHWMDAGPIEARELDREAFVAAVVDLAMLDAALEFADRIPSASRSDLDPLPTALREPHRRFTEAASRARRRLETLDPAVQVVLDSLRGADPTSAGAVRTVLRENGLHPIAAEPERIRVEPGPTELRRRPPRGAQQWALLAVAPGGEDIDLWLADMKGNPVDLDNEPDSCPLLWVDAPTAGTWTITVVNHATEAIEIELEQWRD